MKSKWDLMFSHWWPRRREPPSYSSMWFGFQTIPLCLQTLHSLHVCDSVFLYKYCVGHGPLFGILFTISQTVDNVQHFCLLPSLTSQLFVLLILSLPTFLMFLLLYFSSYCALSINPCSACCLLYVGFILSLLLSTQDGGNIFFHIVSWLTLDNNALYHRR
jgi:hypothetical protein